MSAHTLIYPMAAMVLLIVIVLITLFRSRVAAVRSGQVDKKYFRLYQGADEPETARKVSRHFTNLFEAPTLFFAACLAAMITGVTGTLFVLLAWGYVLARGVPAILHLGGNRLSKRMLEPTVLQLTTKTGSARPPARALPKLVPPHRHHCRLRQTYHLTVHGYCTVHTS